MRKLRLSLPSHEAALKEMNADDLRESPNMYGWEKPDDFDPYSTTRKGGAQKQKFKASKKIRKKKLAQHIKFRCENIRENMIRHLTDEDCNRGVNGCEVNAPFCYRIKRQKDIKSEPHYLQDEFKQAIRLQRWYRNRSLIKFLNIQTRNQVDIKIEQEKKIFSHKLFKKKLSKQEQR